jgi:hypothetical protein
VNDEMTLNDADDLDRTLDRMLLSEEPLAPSSGFAAAVMDSVREAAMEPPPLPFPWARFAIGAIACGVSAAAGTTLIVGTDWSALLRTREIAEIAEIAKSLPIAAPDIGYAAAAVLGTVALLLLQRRSHRRPPTSSR